MIDLIKDKIKPAFFLLLSFSILLGLIYPLLITAIAQIIFPWQANGSLIYYQNKVIGSALIGQYFTDPKYFWGRISQTRPYPYNAANSSGSNLSASNPHLIKTLKEQIQKYKLSEVENARNSAENLHTAIPIDLLTSSASGLDPEISPLSAYYQVSRIAKARNMPPEMLKHMVEQNIKGRFLGILGEARVNVLELNLILDQVSISKVQK